MASSRATAGAAETAHAARERELRDEVASLGAALRSRARHQVGLISHHPFLKSDQALPICLSPVVSYGVIAGRGLSPALGPSLSFQSSPTSSRVSRFPQLPLHQCSCIPVHSQRLSHLAPPHFFCTTFGRHLDQSCRVSWHSVVPHILTEFPPAFRSLPTRRTASMCSHFVSRIIFPIHRRLLRLRVIPPLHSAANLVRYSPIRDA
jgi:hypothetical protein